MQQLSEFVTILENMADLEVSIIRKTKINKVLKGILKLEAIPREEEFKFKERSQILLDKWNKLMADETPPAPATAAVNGVNGGSAEKQAGDNAAKAGSEQSKSREPSHASAEKTKEPSKEPATEQVEQAAARDNSEKQKPSGEAVCDMPILSLSCVDVIAENLPCRLKLLPKLWKLLLRYAKPAPYRNTSPSRPNG